ncbi:ATP-binding protein [Anaerophaga thermohalophila]|uniref:ATP-binding protein n=1 Tax=Anaerophaga thermohalophila TaxID=177400 RepID=UPI0003724804|nr:ATP-binding protein [Anaerophaga thermohalophila]
MERIAMQELVEWKNRPGRKPLVLRGARQVGKTWLIKEFGRREYNRVAYVNFERSKELQTLFKENFDVRRILTALQIETGVRITASDTLIVFDEVQEAEGALTALKYFYENYPEYHVIAAGSLLGVSLHRDTSFPVGKVEFCNLYPLNFAEFLKAAKQFELLDLLNNKDWDLIRTFKDRYIQLLKQYYFVGGMPEVVSCFVENNDFNEVRTFQKNILTAYEFDFSKHAPNEVVPRIRMLWNSIPKQLAKENKKFIYGAIRSGARARDYELALSWLIDSGLVHKVCRVSKPGMPLKAYAEANVFKLFVTDVGLLGAMVDIDKKSILEGNRIFEEFKGALTEQYVLQEILTFQDLFVYYWSTEKSMAEIDFVIQHQGEVFPIEVKAEENLRAKSLRSFYQRFHPRLALRFSMSDFREEDWLTNVPLYAVYHFMNSINKQ